MLYRNLNLLRIYLRKQIGQILLNEEEAVFHRPHPQKETDKGAVVSVRTDDQG